MLLTEIKNIDNSIPTLKKFGRTIGIFLIILNLILFFIKINQINFLFATGLIILVSTFIYPLLLKPLNTIWMSLAIILSWFSTRLILIVLFYLLITPISFIAKIFRKQFLDLKMNKKENSYWIKRKSTSRNEKDYEYQF